MYILTSCWFAVFCGAGAFTIAIRKMYGQRAVSKLKEIEASKAVLSSIVLDLAAVLGIGTGSVGVIVYWL